MLDLNECTPVRFDQPLKQLSGEQGQSYSVSFWTIERDGYTVGAGFRVKGVKETFFYTTSTNTDGGRDSGVSTIFDNDGNVHVFEDLMSRGLRLTLNGRNALRVAWFTTWQKFLEENWKNPAPGVGYEQAIETLRAEQKHELANALRGMLA